MKFLLLGDLHFGVKQDDPWMQNIQRLAMKQAIEYSKLNGITHWIQSGDWFDVRKAITHKTMEFTREIAMEIDVAGITVDVIVGNHDMSLKQKIHPNACTELLTQFKNFNIHDRIKTVMFDSIAIDMCPWICDENQNEIMDFIENSKSKYCIGHFELTGFYFYKNMKSNGSDPAFLRKYKKVWSGHFHTQSENRNVQYIGTPYSITSGDENDKRGFWVFDTETETTEFIENDTMWHQSITYPTSVNPVAFKDLSVRVFVESLDSKFAKFESELENYVHDLKVITKIDSVSDFDESESQDIEVKSIVDLMDEYIDLMSDVSDVDKKEAKHISKKLYMECIK